MARASLSLAVLLAFLTTACTGEVAFEDRSDEVKIRHRIPSK
jgi:hypothetical protein